jgi:hypothetical protein
MRVLQVDMCYRFYVDVLLLYLLMRVFNPELYLGNVGKL